MQPPQRSRVQSTHVTYALHSLGWKAFQDLCVAILSDVLGQTVQTFLPTRDGGRDGAFAGTWKTSGGEAMEGTFVVQCKYTQKEAKNLSPSGMEDELGKAGRLAAAGSCRNYILMTNAGVSAETDAELRRRFTAIAGIDRFTCYGSDWISRVIRESPRLRALVPRVYGLGDLSLILDERAAAQAREILSSMGDDLGKFVQTDAFRRSAKALLGEGFVLLLGEPASGKSTIGAVLAVSAIDLWGCETYKIRSAEEFTRHWNPDEPKRFFWVDDAFGATQHETGATLAWNHVLPELTAAVRRGARVLFTSRDYIYRSAKPHLKESAFPLLRESQVVINVQQLSKPEKEQILYNHVRLGRQPQAFRTEVKPFLRRVATSQHFLPEVARRLGDPMFTGKLNVTQEGLTDFVERPMDFLADVVRGLDAGCRAALALVFMNGGSLPSPVTVTAQEQRALELIGAGISAVTQSLGALEGSLTLRTWEDGRSEWRFRHPTIRDAFASHVAEEPELLDIYLAGAPEPRLAREVACGVAGIAGVKVMVPHDRYPSVARRIAAWHVPTLHERGERARFLSERCDAAFLRELLTQEPTFPDGLRIHHYLDCCEDAVVLAKLARLGILEECTRLRAVATIEELVTDMPDAGFVSGALRPLFRGDEFERIKAHVRDEVLPRLEEFVESERDNIRRDRDPGDEFYYFSKQLDDLKDGFVGDDEAISMIEGGEACVCSTIDVLRSKSEDEPDDDPDLWPGSVDAGAPEPSTFDDVDS